MKKTLLTAVVIATSFGAFAQQQKTANASNLLPASLLTNQNIALKSITTTTTTLFTPPSFASSTCSLVTGYGVGAGGVGGYVAGDNKYGDLEKAQKYSLANYSLTLPATINQTYLYIGTKKAGGPGTGLISVKIYADNAGAPGTLLGTSIAVPVASLTASSYSTNIFTFSTPVNLTTSIFYTSVDFSNAGLDTLSLVSTKNSTVTPCALTDTLNSWEAYSSPVTFALIKCDWGLSIDLGIFPVVTGTQLTTGINNTLNANLSVLSAFPNPASDELSISYALNTSSNVEIEIYDMTGKLISTTKLGKLEVGNHKSQLDISNLNSGLYMYSVKLEDAKSFGKFTIAK
jgi:hypothetical protein